MSSTSPPTSLGMPALPPPTSAPTWRAAWDEALYGARGFFRTQAPAAHFRTSVHASPLFAGALVRLARSAGLDTVVDIGAGRGELLTAMRRIDPGLDLLGVEVAARPAGLDTSIAWTTALPESVEGLVVANEWLDNIPCHVVEVDDDGVPRMVHVDPGTGEESLGRPLRHASVPDSLAAWCERWWPEVSSGAAGPGARAEVGTSRDAAWADVVRRVTRGLAVAVDYGHTRERRPPFGSLRSYRDGREVEVRPDGSRDVTAHVAVDAVAAAVGGPAAARVAAGVVAGVVAGVDGPGAGALPASAVLRQREALSRLGVSGARPELGGATSDPAGYLAALAQAGEAAELTAAGGLGDFFWVVTTVGGVAHPLAE